MPNVIGLAEADARAVVANIGLGSDSVSTSPQPAAGQAGLVVDQTPAAGQRSGDKVTLRISAPATMPTLIGKSESEARAALTALGARIVINQAFDPTKAEGTVLAVDPPQGSPLTDSATLTVAEAPSSVLLATLKAVNNGCSSDQAATGAGQNFDHAFLCSAGTTSAEVLDYVADKRASVFRATFTQSDRSDTHFGVVFKVIADGKTIFTQTVGFGTAVPVSLNVGSALRVRVEMIVAGPAAACCGDGVTALVGSAQFVGAPAAIDHLVAESQP